MVVGEMGCCAKEGQGKRGRVKTSTGGYYTMVEAATAGTVSMYPAWLQWLVCRLPRGCYSGALSKLVTGVGIALAPP